MLKHGLALLLLRADVRVAPLIQRLVSLKHVRGKFRGKARAGSDLVAQHHAADFSARLILKNCRAAHGALAVHLLVEAAKRLFQAHVAHDASAIQHAESFPIGRLPRRLAQGASERVVVEQQRITAALADAATCTPSNKLKCGE